MPSAWPRKEIGATVIDPRWVVPVPASVITFAAEHRLVITIEDGVRVGGIGTRIRQDMRAAGVDTAVSELGLPDQFLEHGSREYLLEQVGLTPPGDRSRRRRPGAGQQDPGGASASGRAHRIRARSREMTAERYTVNDYLLDRLAELGVDRIFGVPGGPALCSRYCR